MIEGFKRYDRLTSRPIEPLMHLIGIFASGEYYRITGGYSLKTVLELPGTYTDALGKVKPKRSAKYDHATGKPRRLVMSGEEACADTTWMQTPWKLARATALNMRCYLCAERLEGVYCSMDHVVPRSKGGRNRQDNMLVVHVACNAAKGSRLPTKRELACLDRVNEKLAR